MSRIHVGVGGGREVTVSTSYRSGKSGGPTDPASRRSAMLLLLDGRQFAVRVVCPERHPPIRAAER
jgi:hypothetical protein